MKYLLLLLPILAGCTPFGPPLASKCESKPFVAEIQIVENVDKYRRQLPFPVAKNGKYEGFILQRKSGEYVLVVPPLKGQKDKVGLETWGHELAHIACGEWHDAPL